MMDSFHFPSVAPQSSIGPTRSQRSNKTSRRQNTACDQCKRKRIKCVRVEVLDAQGRAMSDGPCRSCLKTGVDCTSNALEARQTEMQCSKLARDVGFSYSALFREAIASSRRENWQLRSESVESTSSLASSLSRQPSLASSNPSHMAMSPTSEPIEFLYSTPPAPPMAATTLFSSASSAPSTFSAPWNSEPLHNRALPASWGVPSSIYAAPPDPPREATSIPPASLDRSDASQLLPFKPLPPPLQQQLQQQHDYSYGARLAEVQTLFSPASTPPLCGKDDNEDASRYQWRGSFPLPSVIGD